MIQRGRTWRTLCSATPVTAGPRCAAWFPALRYALLSTHCKKRWNRDGQGQEMCRGVGVIQCVYSLFHKVKKYATWQRKNNTTELCT